ncbi:hypothetical protein Q7C_2618 [Methylophaga frappieri]|uniref:DUF6602 domain-containing protein n=1 Tax=Methylophaga frappieri (strain ATCC BAA-2434 / DSM 25690 / JAM7) TaxID=754477 RepID=I1YLE6_METFJ|nr:DUF6602 domain-containing protein [Methylophaga frappieri]AFJ03739.1 hypothetical protein Q7C_2618 [Methylophaga frappieri]
MSDWSLESILSGLHDDIERRLETVRSTIKHPGTKGDASETVWIDLFNKYLPSRYKADKAHVVDSKNNFSQQIDVVIYDRQYTPFIFHFEGQIIIPAESVYAVFEAKQSANLDHVKYAQEKVQSVRRLHRTSLPIPYAGGTYPPKPLIPIYGGLLTFESDWSPAIGNSLLTALKSEKGDGKLDFGCLAAHGYFHSSYDANDYTVHAGGKPATAFLFKLISQLQLSATVPMIDIQAYSSWLNN